MSWVRIPPGLPITTNSQKYIVTTTDAGQRFDVWCVGKLPQFSRAVIQRAIKSGEITLDGQRVKPRQIVAAGATVNVAITIPTPPPAVITSLELPIIFEDNDVVVINKPAGVLAHSGVGNNSATISDWLVQHYPTAAGIGEAGTARSGIVHRLDKDTSGVMIMAKSETAYNHLKAAWQKERVRKEYLALVYGIPGETDGRIVQALSRSKRNPMRRTVDPAGKLAITEWRKIQTLASPGGQSTYALLRVFPFTGRTHQIRVHLHWLGFPIVGDALYTFKRQRPPHGVTRQLLHAEKLSLELPNGDPHTFTAPLPPDFQAVIDQLLVIEQ